MTKNHYNFNTLIPEIEAKIDTGAYSTSIDEDLARELGFSNVIDYFEKIEKPKKIKRGEGIEIIKKMRKKHLGKIKDLFDMSVVYSSHGNTIRPKIKLKYIMDKEKIISKANVVARGDLEYPVIVGRRDLKKFLIEV